MKPTTHLKFAAVASLALGVASANAANIYFDDFESFTTANNSISAPLNLDDTNWAEVSYNTNNQNLQDGNGGAGGPVVGGNVRNDQGGFGGVYGGSTININSGVGVRVRSSNGAMLNQVALPLVSLGAATVSLSFDLKQHTANYVHVIEFSTDIGFTSPVLLDTINGNGVTLDLWEARSYTLTDGVEATFTDDAYFRIRKLRPSPSGTNGGANSTYHVYDNVSIDFTPVPEPSSLALLGLGGLALLRRRR